MIFLVTPKFFDCISIIKTVLLIPENKDSKGENMKHMFENTTYHAIRQSRVPTFMGLHLLGDFLLIGTFLSPQIRSGGYKNSQRKLRHHSTRLENFHDDHLSN